VAVDVLVAVGVALAVRCAGSNAISRLPRCQVELVDDIILIEVSLRKRLPCLEG
jgi:hypothetical protein